MLVSVDIRRESPNVAELPNLSEVSTDPAQLCFAQRQRFVLLGALDGERLARVDAVLRLECLPAH